MIAMATALLAATDGASVFVMRCHQITSVPLPSALCSVLY